MSRSGFYRAQDGSERIWLERDDIEAMMEDELRKAGLYPSPPKPRVDVEQFIETHLRVRMDQHAALEPGVLGLTEFYVDAPPRISINQDLSGAIDDDDTSQGIRGRWRATMAHEASHVVMHRVLFELASGQETLFELESPRASGRMMRCMKQAVLFRSGPKGDWREVQANMGMAALLMPRGVFRATADAVRDRLAIDPRALVVGSRAAATLAAEIATACDVSKQAAAIRLETLGLVRPLGQEVLAGA